MFIDIFVAPVPTANKQSYLDHATLAADVFKDNGAVQVIEAWGDQVPDGEVTSFLKAVQIKEDETVVCGFVIWPDKDTKDKGMAAAMQDTRMAGPMPFDGKRLIFGSFEQLFQK